MKLLAYLSVLHLGTIYVRPDLRPIDGLKGGRR